MLELKNLKDVQKISNQQILSLALELVPKSDKPQELIIQHNNIYKY